jgi:pimeloyl-ACP methyl ester carboxylesterase
MRRLTTAGLVLFGAAALLGVAPSTTSAQTAQPAASIAAAPDQFMNVGAIKIRYRSAGTGHPIVLLHGVAEQIEVWQGIGDSLARGYRVIALDLPGFGASSKPADTAAYGVAYVSYVIAVMDSLKLTRASVAGHSLGGLLAANVALRHPDRVHAAISIAGAFADDATTGWTLPKYIADMDQGRGYDALIRYLFPTMPDSAVRSLNAEVLKGMTDVDRRAAAAAMRAFPTLSISGDRAAAARVPVLFIAASDDPLTAGNRALASRWRGGRLLIVPASDHDNIMTKPELLAAMRQELKRRAQ